ncbi:hypothetical protein LOD99_10862 [Oopsacas minuta]|uniref:Uncharacterized protein n=1 Tax=Oopsacas minuta TaxID=111878 RepID=A0AAV7KDJ6_9METZ|nr:hypothetical protein LOD99_10862 [Oopsacas minuta]
MVEDIHDNEIAPYDESLGNLLASTRIEEPLYIRKDTFRPSIFFGKAIPIVHRPGLYLHLLIIKRFTQFLRINLHTLLFLPHPIYLYHLLYTSVIESNFQDIIWF